MGGGGGGREYVRARVDVLPTPRARDARDIYVCVLRSTNPPTVRLKLGPPSKSSPSSPSSEATPSELRLWWQYYGSSREKGEEEKEPFRFPFHFAASFRQLAFPRPFIGFISRKARQFVSIYRGAPRVEIQRRRNRKRSGDESLRPTIHALLANR